MSRLESNKQLRSLCESIVDVVLQENKGKSDLIKDLTRHYLTGWEDSELGAKPDEITMHWITPNLKDAIRNKELTLKQIQSVYDAGYKDHKSKKPYNPNKTINKVLGK